MLRIKKITILKKLSVELVRRVKEKRGQSLEINWKARKKTWEEIGKLKQAVRKAEKYGISN